MSDQHGPDIPQQVAPDNSFERMIAKYLDKHAVVDWRLVHRMRSMQIAFFWAIIAGLWVALPAFQSWVKPVPFAILCVAFSIAICIARLTKQKGLPDV
jgi:hypothetical protein